MGNCLVAMRIKRLNVKTKTVDKICGKREIQENEVCSFKHDVQIEIILSNKRLVKTQEFRVQAASELLNIGGCSG